MLLIAGVCSICCEHLNVVTDVVSVVECGHLFHGDCLQKWMATCKNKATCPNCRIKIDRRRVINTLYPDLPKEEASEQMAASVAQKKLVEERDKREKAEGDLRGKVVELEDALNECRSFENNLSQVRIDLIHSEEENKALKSEVRTFKREVVEVKALRKQNKKLSHQLKDYVGVEKVLEGKREEVNQLLESYKSKSGSSPEGYRLATFCIALKQEFDSVKHQKTMFLEELTKTKRSNLALRRNKIEFERSISEKENLIEELKLSESSLQDEVGSLKRKITKLEQAIASPSGDTKHSAISRLIAESPAPLNLQSRKREVFGESPVLEKKQKVTNSDTRNNKNFIKPEKLSFKTQKETPVKYELKKFNNLYNTTPNNSKLNAATNRHRFDGLGGFRRTPTLLQQKQMKKWTEPSLFDDDDLLKDSPGLSKMNNRFSKLKKFNKGKIK